MTQDQITAVLFSGVDALVVVQDILWTGAHAVWVVVPSVTASDLHLQLPRHYLSILPIIKSLETLAVIVGVQLPTLLSTLAIAARVARRRHEGR